MRCMWRAGIGGTDSGTAMQGPSQPVQRLEWWNFTAPSGAELKEHEEYDRRWRRCPPPPPGRLCKGSASTVVQRCTLLQDASSEEKRGARGNAAVLHVGGGGGWGGCHPGLLRRLVGAEC